MSRWLLVSSVLFACGGGNREVSKIKYTHTSCADCGIAPDGGKQFVPPDEDQQPKAVPTTSPEPTCQLVAETLVSMELGNYAEPEDRAPKVAAEERRCNGMRLSRDDRQCIVDSTSRASIAYCVPALFPKEPQPAGLSQARCDQVAKQMMTNLDARLRAQRVPDQRVWERQLLAAIDACRADRWNEAMAQCAIYYVPMDAVTCQYVQPTAMWKRLEARLAKARAD
jgi:hypothetical protein